MKKSKFSDSQIIEALETSWPARAARSAWSQIRRLFDRPSIDN